jgi:hypothetical protein
MRVPCPGCSGTGKQLADLGDGPMCISPWPKVTCKCCGGCGVQETDRFPFPCYGPPVIPIFIPSQSDHGGLYCDQMKVTC